MGITIKELSEISGYSQSTISRVITNKGNVKKETRQDIEQLLRKYDYRTNIMELRASGKIRSTVMVIVGDLHNWYYMEMISELNKILKAHEYTPMIGFSDNDQQLQNEYVQKAYDENYAGIIFLNVVDGEDLKGLLTRKKCPVVFLNRNVKSMDMDTICTDNYKGGYLATSYLIEMGHRKIVHLTGTMYSATTFERMRGYEEAMKAAKLPVTNSNIYYGNLKSDSGYEFGVDYVKKGLDFTAVFCGNDLMAMGFMEAMRDFGINIPEDVSVICYDDTPLVANGRIRMTTVGVEPSRMAKGAVELLLGKINGEEQDARTILYSPHLSQRDSVKKRNENTPLTGQA